MSTLETLIGLFQIVQGINDEPKPHPGLAKELILASFDRIKLHPPADLVALYEWHDGIDHLNAFLHFDRLETSISDYISIRTADHDYGLPIWKKTWFPFMNINGDISLCIDVSSGELAALDMEDDWSVIVATHYSSYVSAIHEFFATNAFNYDPISGSIEPKSWETWGAIARKHNVRPYWWRNDIRNA